MLQYAKHEKVTRNSSHLKPHYSHGNKKILKNQEKTSNNSPSLASKAPLKVPFMMLNEDIPSESNYQTIFVDSIQYKIKMIDLI